MNHACRLALAAGALTVATVATTAVSVPGADAGAAARAPQTATRLTPDDLFLRGYPAEPVRVGDALYYQAHLGGASDRELWRTTDDGTTEQVTDINPDGDSEPFSLTPAGDLLLYAANDGTTGFELWQTDTTTGETTRLTDLDDIPPKPPTHGSQDEVDGSTSPTNLTVVGDTLFFQGDDGRTGRELWQTDLTTGTTTQVADLVPGKGYSDSSPSALTVVGRDLYFMAYSARGLGQIWRHDTRTGRTVQVTHLDVQASAYYDQDAIDGVFPVADGSLFFAGADHEHGSEPWSLDLSTGRAHLLRDVRPGRRGSGPDEATVAGHRVFFAADDGATGRELWQTDTRTGKTRQRADVQPGGKRSGSYPQELTAAGSVLYFSARAKGDDQELWRTARHGRGALQVADINPGPKGSWPVDLVTVGEDVYFRPSAVGGGAQVWQAGRDGAQLAADLAADDGTDDHTFVESLLTDDDRLIFRVGNDSYPEYSLWTLE